MATGMEMMLKNVIDGMMKNLPPEIRAQIDMFGQTVLAFKAQQDRIEAKLDAVLAVNPQSLEHTEGEEHGQRPEQSGKPEHG